MRYNLIVVEIRKRNPNWIKLFFQTKMKQSSTSGKIKVKFVQEQHCKIIKRESLSQMLVWRGKDMKNNKYIKREKKQRPISDFNLALSLPNEEGVKSH